MKVTVDPLACETNAVCVRLAPQVFSVREDDAGDDVLVIAGDGQVPPDLADRVELAVARCPKAALSAGG